ncbi:MAG: dienelactone hydrolase family protein, partial [Nocardiopsaceae bacterium]|nr:dienelactone hydrolase family protein [Nocardiopsaceae bacterium]
RVELAERAELHRRARRYRGDRPPVPVHGRTVIIADDGVATGSTARAACQVARAQGAAWVVLAAPVAPPAVRNTLAGDADEVIVLQTPARFAAIGEWYADFSQTSDAEVIALLQQGTAGGTPARLDREVTVEAGPVRLPGHLSVPAPAAGLVVFAHGSGSGRMSPRNRYVAGVLTEAGLGTLLFDLLTPEEEGNRSNVFDIGLLAARLTAATGWLREQEAAVGVPVGYFGASTGAAAALWAAAEPGNEAAAVVSRGGRPDLAIPRLDQVTAPTLLIVGGLDHAVIGMNRDAQQHLRCENKLTVVPGASHLFEEPGALERVAELARDWFTSHLAPAHATA